MGTSALIGMWSDGWEALGIGLSSVGVFTASINRSLCDWYSTASIRTLRLEVKDVFPVLISLQSNANGCGLPPLSSPSPAPTAFRSAAALAIPRSFRKEVAFMSPAITTGASRQSWSRPNSASRRSTCMKRREAAARVVLSRVRSGLPDTAAHLGYAFTLGEQLK